MASTEGLKLEGRLSGVMARATSSRFPQQPKERELSELIAIIEDLIASCSENLAPLQFASTITGCLLRLRHTIIDNDGPTETKDTLRQLHGFGALFSVIKRISENYCPYSLTAEERKGLLILYKDTLGVLAEGLRDHPENKQYFADNANSDGKAVFEETLATLAEKACHVDGDTELLYGGVLAAALCQETVADIFTTLNTIFQDESTLSRNDIVLAVGRRIGALEVIEVPELLGPFLRIWLSQSSSRLSYRVQRLSLPACLHQIALQSRRNAVALHAAGLLTSVLPLLFNSDRPEAERAIYHDFAHLLFRQGISSLDDAIFLYRMAHHSLDALQTLVYGLRYSKELPFIQFDMSLNGFCSLEFPCLSRQFPPANSSGYTLSVWARFDHLEQDSHTTIFGAFDPSQAFFLLVYVEKGTGNLILQTSVKGLRPSVRFKSTSFQPSRWYHIVLVHRRPKPPSSFRASLFVDGKFAEQLKIEYPYVPVSSSTAKALQVQAFFGTPQDLATRLGKGVSTSRWSLAGAALFDEAYSDDLISVLYHIGARYYGNFQDSLGSFQTYDASAALSLRNEQLHPGKEENSDIITAISRKAGVLVRESSILIKVSPAMALHDNSNFSNYKTYTFKSLSREAIENLQHLMETSGRVVVINGGVPSINDALIKPYGVGNLVGDPVIFVPQPLDDISWRIGGCVAVHISLFHAANTPDSTLLAVESLYEAVHDSWRNSEAMERENGYGILAAMLNEKLSLYTGSPSKTSTVCSTYEERSVLALQLLRLTLKFVGYDFEHPDRSIISNPLAYRILLVDLDIWRSGNLELLQLYYSQFSTFATESQYRRFNAKRLTRMRVCKKLLDALKGEEFTAAALQLFTSAYRSLMESYFSADLHRSLALFITYSIHKPTFPGKPQKPDVWLSTSSQQTSTTIGKSEAYVSPISVAVEMLRVYCGFLCDAKDIAPLRRFARAVTNKWLLYLICEDDPEIVALATKILARLIVVHGNGYSKKFSEKTGGYIIMQRRLKKWWNIPALWLISLAILFGRDVALLHIDRKFDHTYFSGLLLLGSETRVTFPEIIPVIANMIQGGLVSAGAPYADTNVLDPPGAAYGQEIAPSTFAYRPVETPAEGVSLLTTVIDTLGKMRTKCQSFRNFTMQPLYIPELLFSVFPAITGSNIISAASELSTSSGRPSSSHQKLGARPGSSPAAALRTTTVERSEATDKGGGSLRRGSSFILVSSDRVKFLPSTTKLRYAAAAKRDAARVVTDYSAINRVLEHIIDIIADQLLEQKDFPGLGIYFRTPPCSHEHLTRFCSWLLRDILRKLEHIIMTPRSRLLLLEPLALMNIGRFATHIGEALYEGWFVNGAACAIDFFGTVLEYLQRPDICHLKSIRLCSQAVGSMRSTLFRAVLFKISEIDDIEVVQFLEHLAYWQAVLFSTPEAQSDYLQLFCYLIYSKLISDKEDIRFAAANLWRIILVQQPGQVSALLSHATAALQHRLGNGFQSLAHMEDNVLLQWIDNKREDLDSLFFGALSRSWDAFAQEENRRIDESVRVRASKREEKLKQWSQAEKLSEETIRKHEATFPHWVSNITSSELLKHQRAIQDHHDNSVFMWNVFSRMSIDLRRFGGILAGEGENKWRLDRTEGRSRMRLRVIPDNSVERQDYQPKQKASKPLAIKICTEVPTPLSGDTITLTPATAAAESVEGGALATDSGSKVVEDSFEMIDDPKIDPESYEDKNRKVMRSLHRGDQVQGVSNMSRITGLEACEGLLITGKDYIYIVDNFFQRSDGEIVDAWQAPPDEQDLYIRMISGREASQRKMQDHETRSWKWADLVSVSKRRFLFRNVALEIFFTDGSSYLLTFVTPQARDDLYTRLGSKAPQVTGSISHSRPEDAWRFETLRSQEDAPQSLGSKVASVFGHSPAYAATRQWVRGEISNFHYLMLINTLAGRTFNDLTQYPVFPWVLADYTSEELDLTNRKVFRDLSKPMGCQSIERETEFRERYKAFAEMCDDDAPPFHYGTHYSSAMIVTSYLIRLQPFVKSYLLLQGGTFDHADRLFYSVQKAWESASRGGMSDVRELIPEFFYLPEFLINSNKYEFGILQNRITTIDSVELPPWAKGDPKIFIAKHREALESPYVSENLHRWIDLVFGCKQRGDAAIEAVNVFHHLSYHGAKDVDNIDDPVERLATIGIIHNFGQTPHQIFNRPHPPREERRYRTPRLDQLAESLIQISTVFHTSERVLSLVVKQDRLICSPAFRVSIPPDYEKCMEWGYSDGSIRFYAADSRKLLGHFEQLHIGQISCAIFADSRTLVTSGIDCTISVWIYTAAGKTVDLQLAVSLFGHRSPVAVLAVSRSFSTLLSASSDGQVMLWDLNRRCFVRDLPASEPVDCAQINDATGDIAICRGSRISLYTLNGALLVEQMADELHNESILTCEFYTGVNNEWLERELIFTGHRRGVVNIWVKVICNGHFELELIRQLHHTDNSCGNGMNITAGISCILPRPTIVYTGDEEGQVYEWSCVQRR